MNLRKLNQQPFSPCAVPYRLKIRAAETRLPVCSTRRRRAAGLFGLRAVCGFTLWSRRSAKTSSRSIGNTSTNSSLVQERTCCWWLVENSRQGKWKPIHNLAPTNCLLVYCILYAGKTKWSIKAKYTNVSFHFFSQNKILVPFTFMVSYKRAQTGPTKTCLQIFE